MTDISFPLDIPKRNVKPRSHGLTSLFDIGMPISMAQSYMEDFASLVDVAKLAVGTAYVMPNVEKKVAMYQSYGIKVQFGGTLFEKFYSQGKADAYIDFIMERGVDVLEISHGSVDVPFDVIEKMINDGKNRGLTVFVEFGSKDPDKIITPNKWVAGIKSYLNAGADYVITEARDSGTAGMFRPSGELRTGLVEEIGDAIDINKILFEAPTPQSQMYFINVFGPNVSLANVMPVDVLVLEAQRRGLRYETFNLS